MKCKYVFLATIIFSTPLVATAGYTVDCKAYNAETSVDVNGKCTDGKYEGQDTETGKTVRGECEDYGEVSAYDSETGEYVYGECEGIKKAGE